MEENNTMEERKLTVQEVENLLNEVSSQAKTQCEQLAKKCQFLESQLMYKRLDYLFKIIENSGNFSMEFVQKCSAEIEAALTIPEDIEVGDTKEVTE